MAVRRVVIAEHGQRPQHRDTRRVARHQDHRLLLMPRRVRVGLAHHDKNLAARVHRARGPPFAGVDDIAAVALAPDAGLDIGRVGRGHRRLGHREGGADFAVEQRLQPPVLLLLRRVAHQRFHVAGIGGRAVERLRRDRRAPHDLAQGRVFEIGQAGAVFALGQEQVPQPGGARLGLQLLHDRRHLPAVPGLRHLLLEDFLGRIDLGLHELAQPRREAFHLVRRFEIHSSPLRAARSTPARYRYFGW